MIAAFLASRAGQWVVGVVGIVVVTALAILKIFAAGKQAARTESMEGQLSNVRAANEAKREVDTSAAAGAVPDGVRKFYTDK
jgi:hypothetical protein